MTGLVGCGRTGLFHFLIFPFLDIDLSPTEQQTTHRVIPRAVHTFTQKYCSLRRAGYATWDLRELRE